MLTLLLVITGICAVAVVYPYVLYPAILGVLPRKHARESAALSTDGAEFSLVFCAFNEAAAMPQKLENLRSLKEKYSKLEVLAFDDGSTDGTAELIQREAPFVRLVRGGGRNGKAHGMKLLAAAAHGDYLIFTDANVLLHEDALSVLAACYRDSEVGGVCGALHYLGAEGSVTAAVGGMYWRLEERIKDLESATGSVMGADGSIFSIRRELYPDFPDTVLDDFTVSMEVVFRGLRLIKCNEVIAFEQLVSARSDEFHRKVRIAARAFHTHTAFACKRAQLGRLDRFKYTSHKTLRWFGGAFLLIGVVTAVTAAAVIGPLLGATALATIALLGAIGLRTSSGVLSSAAEIVLAMAATLIGVLRALHGQTFVVWNPAKSRST